MRLNRLPERLARLPRLEVLNLFHNPIRRRPRDLAALRSLRVLLLVDCPIPPGEPARILRALPRTEVLVESEPWAGSSRPRARYCEVDHGVRQRE